MKLEGLQSVTAKVGKYRPYNRQLMAVYIGDCKNYRFNCNTARIYIKYPRFSEMKLFILTDFLL